MAIAYMKVAVVSRSAGGSAGASAAYITGEAIEITSTQEVAYYVPDDRIQHTEVIGANLTHQQLWDGVETHHKRRDALLAYKMTLALPHELSEKDRIELARQFTKTMTATYGVAASLAIHTSPGKDGNWHAHLQWTSVSVDKETGKLGKKVNDLDPIWCKRNGRPFAVETMRATWATMANEFGTRRGVNLAIDMRSYKRQGSEKIGQLHEGWDNNSAARAAINVEIRAHNASIEKTVMTKSQENAAKLAAIMGGLNVERGKDRSPGTAVRDDTVSPTGNRGTAEERRPIGGKSDTSPSLGELDRRIAEERRQRHIKAGLVPADDLGKVRDVPKDDQQLTRERLEAERKRAERDRQIAAEAERRDRERREEAERKRRDSERENDRGGGRGGR